MAEAGSLKVGDRVAAVVDAERVGVMPGPWLITDRVWVHAIRRDAAGAATVVLTTREPM